MNHPSHSEKRNLTFEVFDTFEDAEASERQAWMKMSHQERMILLEQLRQQSYPHERTSPQGLQRVLSVA